MRLGHGFEIFVNKIVVIFIQLHIDTFELIVALFCARVSSFGITHVGILTANLALHLKENFDWLTLMNMSNALKSDWLTFRNITNLLYNNLSNLYSFVSDVMNFLAKFSRFVFQTCLHYRCI